MGYLTFENMHIHIKSTKINLLKFKRIMSSYLQLLSQFFKRIFKLILIYIYLFLKKFINKKIKYKIKDMLFKHPKLWKFIRSFRMWVKKNPSQKVRFLDTLIFPIIVIFFTALLNIILKKEAWKIAIFDRLKNNPHLETQFIEFLYGPQSSINSNLVLSESTHHLSKTSQRIYADLKAAILLQQQIANL